MSPRVGADPQQQGEAIRRLLAHISYEVMPFKGTGDRVLAHVPTSIPITITVTEAKGLEATLALSERLASAGYVANPHLPARQIRDAVELADISDRLQAAGIERIFVVAGDAPEPRGPYADALSLLRGLDALGRPFTDIGVTGYPEGHGHIADHLLEQALLDKSPYASRVVTQMCFDPEVIAAWADRMRQRGVAANVVAGIPAPVSRQKLVRISAGIGLGQSARFLQKQHSLIWRFLLPGGFSPDRLLRGIARQGGGQPDSPIWGLRLFTFNEIAGTERWRQEWLRRLEHASDDNSREEPA